MADAKAGCQKIILATARGLQFCGAPVREGTSYCEAHYCRIFMKHSAYVLAAQRGIDPETA